MDARSDLYSLGCVLYELLTGEPPYTGPTAQAIVAKRLTDPVPSARRLRETVPPEVDVVLERLLAKSPADRYASAGELAAVLTAVLVSHGGEAAAISPRAPTLPFPPHLGPSPRIAAAWRRVVLIATVLLAVAAGVVVARRVIGRGPPPAAALDPNSVAVLPFRITAPDRSLDYLGEGIVDLLAVKLDGSAGPARGPAAPAPRGSALSARHVDPARRRRRRRPPHGRRTRARREPRSLGRGRRAERDASPDRWRRPAGARQRGRKPRLAAGAGGPARRAAAGGRGRATLPALGEPLIGPGHHRVPAWQGGRPPRPLPGGQSPTTARRCRGLDVRARRARADHRGPAVSTTGDRGPRQPARVDLPRAAQPQGPDAAPRPGRAPVPRALVADRAHRRAAGRGQGGARGARRVVRAGRHSAPLRGAERCPQRGRRAPRRASVARSSSTRMGASTRPQLLAKL